MLDPVILTTIQDVRSVEEKDLKDKVTADHSTCWSVEAARRHRAKCNTQLLSKLSQPAHSKLNKATCSEASVTAVSFVSLWILSKIPLKILHADLDGIAIGIAFRSR